MGRGGFDNHVFGEDWMPPSPSPRSLLSSVAANDALVGSFPNAVDETKSGFGSYFQGPEVQYDPNNPLTQATTSVVAPVDSNALTEHKTSSRGGGLMERMAARAGFNAPRLNTESIWHSDLPKEQVRSPYLTIPPGLSPTTLLDSPVFLANSLVQPSPTTGKFAFASGDNNWNATLMTTDAPDKYEERVFLENNMSFAFKPMVGSESAPDLKVINRKPTSIEQAHASGFYPGFGISAHPDTSFPHQTAQAEKSTSNSMQDDEADPAARNPAASGGAQAEDGYSWRKYGQKQVKGSEYPRSYYKCTHPNCPVKKKVERSHEGHITEIIYKGAHTHPKPPPARHSPALPEAELEGGGGSLISSAMNSNPETPSPPFCEYGGELSPAVGAGGPPARYDPGEGGGLEGSSTFSNEEDNDNDHVKHGSVSLGYDREGDESELKRRRMEAYASEVSGATRAIREPRVVVQTTSEVDILDDGYRWRKYGQKVVKGNPNPRSYYKCTSPGCNVRKHVERASHDLKSVITTYEGKHNHDVPAARNGNQSNSGPPNQHAPTATIAARAHTQRPEPPQTHANMARFEMPSFGPYGLPGGPRHLGPGLGYGFGLGQQRLPGVGLAGLGQHQIHPYLGYGPRAASDMCLVMPKTEPKVEPVMDGGSDGGSLAYQQLMSRFPLGPHM